MFGIGHSELTLIVVLLAIFFKDRIFAAFDLLRKLAR